MVRNIKCGYSFSQLERAEHLGPKLSRFCEIICFATKPHRLQQLHARNAAKYFVKWADE